MIPWWIAVVTFIAGGLFGLFLYVIVQSNNIGDDDE